MNKRRKGKDWLSPKSMKGVHMREGHGALHCCSGSKARRREAAAVVGVAPPTTNHQASTLLLLLLLLLYYSANFILQPLALKGSSYDVNKQPIKQFALVLQLIGLKLGLFNIATGFGTLELAGNCLAQPHFRFKPDRGLPEYRVVNPLTALSRYETFFLVQSHEGCSAASVPTSSAATKQCSTLLHHCHP